MRHGCWLLGLVALAAGCTTSRTGPLRPAAAPVPPTQEIEILDAGQSTTGIPEVVTQVGPDGINRVDIPPTVLVHRYFPSGDRSFQGPMLPGGPTIVSVNHPKTLEREYVTVTMPPGAPRVFYSGHAIIYDYGPQSVTLSFGLCGQPKVSYAQGVYAVEKAKGAVAKAKSDAAELGKAAGLGTGIEYVKTQTRAALFQTANAIGSLRRVPTDGPRE